jgi:hypothetical protein
MERVSQSGMRHSWRPESLAPVARESQELRSGLRRARRRPRHCPVFLRLVGHCNPSSAAHDGLSCTKSQGGPWLTRPTCSSAPASFVLLFIFSILSPHTLPLSRLQAMANVLGARTCKSSQAHAFPHSNGSNFLFERKIRANGLCMHPAVSIHGSILLPLS